MDPGKRLARVSPAETGVVHVIDDDAAVRDSLVMLLESAELVVRAYNSASSFLDLAAGLTSGCVLTDIRMPGLDGLALQDCLAEQHSVLSVIIMSAHGDVPSAVQAVKNGAVDFLEKPFKEESVLRAIRCALATSARTVEVNTRVTSLTPRERDVLDRMVEGKANKMIAFELGSSPRTVGVHRGRVMTKMGARSVAELVQMMVSLRSTNRWPVGEFGRIA